MQVTEMLRQSLMVYKLLQASPLGILDLRLKSRRTVLTTASRDWPQLENSAEGCEPSLPLKIFDLLPTWHSFGSFELLEESESSESSFEEDSERNLLMKSKRSVSTTRLVSAKEQMTRGPGRGARCSSVTHGMRTVTAQRPLQGLSLKKGGLIAGPRSCSPNFKMTIQLTPAACL